MAEYIDRKSLIDEFDRLGLGEHGFVERVFSDGVRTIIAGIPAADVAPVVRCKDCKYYRVGAMLVPNKFCFRLKHPVEDRPIGYNFAPDDFCSHGERKDGDSDG